MKNWQYLKYLLRHKWFVFLACCRQGIPLAGIIHDWSKFLPDEWIGYTNYFYGGVRKHHRGEIRERTKVDDAFDVSWLLHQKRSPHHWQYWILHNDTGVTKILEMPDRYRREMLADWEGAGKAMGKSDLKTWYLKNALRISLAPETRRWVEKQLGFKQEEKNEGAGIPSGPIGDKEKPVKQTGRV